VDLGSGVLAPGREGRSVTMLQWMAGLLADVVLDAAVSAHRLFGTEMNRYFEKRGFLTDRTRTESPTR
jgi:hypothetical protein